MARCRFLPSSWSPLQGCAYSCRRGLQEDPYGEDLQFPLVQAHAMLGRRREALESYRSFEEGAASDLGLILSPRMQALGERIRCARGPKPATR
jgi:DNA-binding SARP family transcriptional activator